MDALGETALHRSAAAGQISACRVLLTHGADITLRSFQGHTAAEVASEPVQKILQGKKMMLFCSVSFCLEYSSLEMFVSEDPPSTGSDVEKQMLEVARSGDMDVVKVKRILSHLNINR